MRLGYQVAGSLSSNADECGKSVLQQMKTQLSHKKKPDKVQYGDRNEQTQQTYEFTPKNPLRIQK